MVGVTKIGRRNVNYWIEAVAEGGDDYYTKPGEAPGQWLGTLAAELGLSGEVGRDEYAALLAGKHPKTGEVLVKRREPRTVVDAAGKKRKLEPILGYDVRFSAPKSVSLLWAIGSEELQETVLAAMDHAVAEGFAYLERHACAVGRGKGGEDIERGAGFIAMNFLHRSSRAGDPALHSHVVTANMTRALSDGSWLSLANPKRQSPLLREAKAAGYVFQAALRSYLTRELGCEWQPVLNGYADILGITRAMIDHFSRRRADIVAEMAERGTSSAAAAEVAAYRTREEKDHGVDVDAQREEWRARGAEFDLTEESIDRLLQSARARKPRTIGEREVADALADLEDRRSHFDRRDLLCSLVNQLPEGASCAQLEAALRSLLASDQVIKVLDGKGFLKTSYYTTPRLLAMEQKVLAVAEKGERAGAALVSEATLTAVLNRHRYLSHEQKEMVRRLTTGGERIVTVAALPGTGKTTTLAVAREAWAATGHPGVGVATARSASGELEDAGIPATSITDLLIRCEKEMAVGRPALPAGAVIVVDEASTTSTPDMEALVDLVEACGGKLALIGDPRQIGSVGAGGVYGRLTQECAPVLLTEIHRQRDSLDRRIVELAHAGQGSDALDLLRTEDRLVIADSLPEALDALVLDWRQRFVGGEDAVMIARRGRDVGDLNAKARQVLLMDGLLGERQVEVAGEQFAVGDRIITRVNHSQVSNRERWKVIGIDIDQTHLKVQRIGGDERVAILTPHYLRRRTESNEPAVQHAYALTTYATQSKTFESAFTLLDDGIAREDFVVAVSRARGHTTAYGVAATDLLDAELGPATREVYDPSQDHRAGAERVASEYTASEVSERKRIEAMPDAAVAARWRELKDQEAHAGTPSPLRRKLAAVERRIGEEESRLRAFTTGRGAFQVRGGRGPDQTDPSESAERLTRQQVDRLLSERDSLIELSRAEVDRPVGLDRDDLAELAMIEDRLLQIRRRDVAVERMRPSEMILQTLGPRPSSPVEAERWNEGVDLIYRFRLQHQVTSAADHPLGKARASGRARRERTKTLAQIERIQTALGKQPLRSLDRAESIGR